MKILEGRSRNGYTQNDGVGEDRKRKGDRAMGWRGQGTRGRQRGGVEGERQRNRNRDRETETVRQKWRETNRERGGGGRDFLFTVNFYI